MKFIKPVSPLLIFSPIIAFFPISIEIIKGFHLGGFNILSIFITSALRPSLNQLVLKSSWEGLQVTVAIALISWIISMFIGTIFGVFSSNIFWRFLPKYSFLGSFFRFGLALPRSIHEVVWGLLFIQILGLNIWVAIISIIVPYSALTARVISEQLDSFDIKSLIALRGIGSKSFASMITILLPKLIPILSIYGPLRLECAIRGATLLGIFGLGGIGTELYLTLRSLEFSEMWTSLWMLFFLMIFLEKIIRSIRNNFSYKINLREAILITISIFLISLSIGLTWLYLLDFDIFVPIKFTTLNFPTFIELRDSFFDLPLLKLIMSTILITLFASGIAIATPPFFLLLFPSKLSQKFQNLVWILFRLIPPPLSALIILIFTSPNLYVAALSLGITHMGAMGRFLTDSILNQDKEIYLAMKSNGSNKKSAILYGILTPKSNSYLAYGSCRLNLILKETAIIGAVGGVGLGWQLQESLSSFDWAQVMIITTTFSILTILAEFIFKNSQDYCIKNSTNNFSY